MEKIATMKIVVPERECDVCLIEASKLSLKDEFMCHSPTTENQKMFKDMLTEVIQCGIKDFYRPIMDPSFADAKKTKIQYVAGKEAFASRKSYNWWEKTAKEFMPERNSRLGTKNEYIAFLGVLIKLLIKNGWSENEAWYAVCDKSANLGMYFDSSKVTGSVEPTGSKEILGLFDLATSRKILAKDEKYNGFWLASGHYYSFSDENPLAYIVLAAIDSDSTLIVYLNPENAVYNESSYDEEILWGTGWIVFET